MFDVIRDSNALGRSETTSGIRKGVIVGAWMEEYANDTHSAKSAVGLKRQPQK